MGSSGGACSASWAVSSVRVWRLGSGVGCSVVQQVQERFGQRRAAGHAARLRDGGGTGFRQVGVEVWVMRRVMLSVIAQYTRDSLLEIKVS